MIIPNNIQIGYYRRRRSVNGHTASKTEGLIKMFSCRSILFYVLYVTFSLFVRNLIIMLVTSRAMAYSPVAYG